LILIKSRIVILLILISSGLCFTRSVHSLSRNRPLPGYVVHFDFIASEQEGRDLVKVAVKGGAKVINVVPPAHVWEREHSVRMLNGILDEISRQNLKFVICRIDASAPPDGKWDRYAWLFGEVLTKHAIMPSGRETNDLFMTTVGREGYAEWMEEEIRYYARNYGRNPRLIGINLGPFSEPLISQRGGFLAFEPATGLYEVTQYTPQGRSEWHRWLAARFGKIEKVNAEYGTSFPGIPDVPLPLNGFDSRFGRAGVAFYDWVRCINDWFVERYRRCREIWHREGGRKDVPLILQFSCGIAEKIYLGRPEYAAFDLPGWIDMADAVGLSLYTNNGFVDRGHASMEATVRLAATAVDLGKDAFVLESGNEQPNIVLDPVQVDFFGSVGRKLRPRTYIYEFLKERYDDPFKDNPGKVVAWNGQVRQEALSTLRNLMHDIENDPGIPERPALYVVSLSLAARRNTRLGELNGALLELATRIPVRWIPAGKESIARKGIPVIGQDGTVRPPSAEWDRLLQTVPEKGTAQREAWFSAMAKAAGWHPPSGSRQGRH
jgi:hypothetical protein